MAKTKNFQDAETAKVVNSYEHKQNGKTFTNAGVVFPTFLKPEDFQGQELQLINEDYTSENLKNDEGEIKHFFEFVDTETGENYISEKYGHLNYLINEIPEVNRKQPLFLLITHKGKQPMKNNPKVMAHVFQLKWANL